MEILPLDAMMTTIWDSKYSVVCLYINILLLNI